MRVLLVLLIFALGFSGFSTAAHAFDSQKCAQEMPADQNMPDMDDCNSMSGTGKDAPQKTADGKHLCFTCGHNCVPYAALPQSGLPVNTSAFIAPFRAIDMDTPDDISSGLKRPPRSLV